MVLTMTIAPELCIFEGMTSVSALIRATETHPETSRNIVSVFYSRDLPRDKYRQLLFLKAKAQSLGFSLDVCDPSEIDAAANGKTHGGVIAFCKERQFPALNAAALRPDGIYFLLEGVEDPYNFGYTLRSLYAAGVDGVVLPPRNWMTSAGTVARSSAGCSELIDIYIEQPEAAVALFRSAGFRVLCANIRDSVLLYDANLEAPALFVIGGEKRGVSRAVLSMTTQNIRIGYGREFSGSLPTAEAAAVIAFEAAKVNSRIK